MSECTRCRDLNDAQETIRSVCDVLEANEPIVYSHAVEAAQRVREERDAAYRALETIAGLIGVDTSKMFNPLPVVNDVRAYVAARKVVITIEAPAPTNTKG